MFLPGKDTISSLASLCPPVGLFQDQFWKFCKGTHLDDLNKAGDDALGDLMLSLADSFNVMKTTGRC